MLDYFLPPCPVNSMRHDPLNQIKILMIHVTIYPSFKDINESQKDYMKGTLNKYPRGFCKKEGSIDVICEGNTKTLKAGEE